MRNAYQLGVLGAVVAAGVAITDAAVAQSSRAAAPAAPMTRAEVLADLKIWRQLGIQDYVNREVKEVECAGYQAARARYRAMRVSPEFEATVARIQGGCAALASSR